MGAVPAVRPAASPTTTTTTTTTTGANNNNNNNNNINNNNNNNIKTSSLPLPHPHPHPVLLRSLPSVRLLFPEMLVPDVADWRMSPATAREAARRVAEGKRKEEKEKEEEKKGTERMSLVHQLLAKEMARKRSEEEAEKGKASVAADDGAMTAAMRQQQATQERETNMYDVLMSDRGQQLQKQLDVMQLIQLIRQGSLPTTAAEWSFPHDGRQQMQLQYLLMQQQLANAPSASVQAPPQQQQQQQQGKREVPLHEQLMDKAQAVAAGQAGDVEVASALLALVSPTRTSPSSTPVPGATTTTTAAAAAPTAHLLGAMSASSTPAFGFPAAGMPSATSLWQSFATTPSPAMTPTLERRLSFIDCSSSVAATVQGQAGKGVRKRERGGSSEDDSSDTSDRPTPPAVRHATAMGSSRKRQRNEPVQYRFVNELWTPETAASSSSARPKPPTPAPVPKAPSSSGSRRGSASDGRGDDGFARSRTGPVRKKCVWCSITHGYPCNMDQCLIRKSLGGIGDDELLGRVRDMRTKYGSSVRKALIAHGASLTEKHFR